MVEPSLLISITLVTITFVIYHGIHKEFYEFFYNNSGFKGPRGFLERAKLAINIVYEKDVYWQFWSPSAEIIKIFISPFTPTIYVISDANLARKVLQDADLFSRPERPSQLLKGILDYALFILPTGPLWKKHRKLLQPGFGPTHLRHTGSVTIKVMDKVNKMWMDRIDKEKKIKVNIKTILGCIAMDVIGLVAFGHDLKMTDQLNTSDDPKWDALEVITSGILIKRALIPSMFWKLAGISSSTPKIKNARNEVVELLVRLATERRKVMKEGGICQEKWEMDVLERLLLSNDSNQVTDEEIFGELLGFFLAGHETSSNTLTFAILELCKNKDIQEKLYQSVKTISLEKETNSLPLIDCSAAPYLDNFLREVQRLHSIVPRVPRKCNENIEIDGKIISAGSIVHVYLKGIHLNPKYHPDPLVFNPDRFNSDIIPGTFLPFGDGGHMCIGYKMATIESKIILIKLVQQYQFDLVPGQSLREYYAITNRLKDGLLVNISKRS